MKKEWIAQLVILLLLYLDGFIEVDHNGIYFSDTPWIDFLFLVYHTVLFLMINYLLIPKLFYRKKYTLFFVSFLGLIVVFGAIEEGVIEKILLPDSRGLNAVTWQSIYWFFGEILVPLLAFVSLKLSFDHFNKQEQLKKIEKDNLSNELKFLKSQIQPHILFNSLNNLYSLVLQKSDKAPDVVLKLSNVLRYVLYETSTQKVALSKELAFVEDYINLQKMQFEGRGIIKCQIHEPSHSEGQLIAPFILIPFIENSFKHSFGSKIKEVNIDIQLNVVNNQLHFYVCNNFEAKEQHKESLVRKGIGLENVKKRLDLLYFNQHKLSIKESNQNYEVTLLLTLV